MRYASMRSLDISNGESVGVSLFVQGCHFHCKNCFNKETWDFNDGKEWNDDTLQEFIKLIDRDYIKRVKIISVILRYFRFFMIEKSVINIYR